MFSCHFFLFNYVTMNALYRSCWFGYLDFDFILLDGWLFVYSASCSGYSCNRFGGIPGKRMLDL